MSTKDRLEIEKKAIGTVKETSSQEMQRFIQSLCKGISGYRITFKAAQSDRKQYKISLIPEGRSSNKIITIWPGRDKLGPKGKGESSIKIIVIHPPHGGYLWRGKYVKREIVGLRISNRTINNVVSRARVTAMLLGAWWVCPNHPDAVVFLSFDRKTEELFWNCKQCSSKTKMPLHLQKQVLPETENDFLNKITIT
jgi:hypothetical protein